MPNSSIKSTSEAPQGTISGEGGTGDQGPFRFVLTLSDESDTEVTVVATTVEGTATAGEDFVAKTKTITFNSG